MSAVAQSNVHDVIVLGAGAAGLMCAGVAAKGGRSVLVLEQARKPGEKISNIRWRALQLYQPAHHAGEFPV